MYKMKKEYSRPYIKVLQFTTSVMKDFGYSVISDVGNGAPARVPAQKLYL